MNKNIFYNYDKVFSYNALLNIIIGERGVGKTYGIKVKLINRFLKHHKKFAYIRRYESDLDASVGSSINNKFFEQVAQEFPNSDFKISKHKKVRNLIIDGQICGYAIPLSVANILKSSTYENVDTIIFDEFLLDKGNYHYLQNEVEQLLDVIETVARLRNIRVIFLGNAISITNPYFEFFNITLPYNSEVKICKKDNKGNPLIVVYYARNQKYRDVKKATRFGQLISDTEYGKYAIDNNFLRDSKYFIRKKTKLAKFYFTLKLGGKNLGVWCDYKEGLMFVSNDYDPNCPIIFSINYEDHDERTLLVRARTSPWFKSIIEHYRLGGLCFENQQIKNNVMTVLVKFLTY